MYIYAYINKYRGLILPKCTINRYKEINRDLDIPLNGQKLCFITGFIFFYNFFFFFFFRFCFFKQLKQSHPDATLPPWHVTEKQGETQKSEEAPPVLRVGRQ